MCSVGKATNIPLSTKIGIFFLVAGILLAVSLDTKRTPDDRLKQVTQHVSVMTLQE